MFADLHCHPTRVAFQRHRNTEVERNILLFHPWHSTTPRELRRSRHGLSRAQADFPALHDARVRLVFAALAPLPRGFVAGRAASEREGTLAREVAAWATGAKQLRVLGKVIGGDPRGAVRELTTVARRPSGPMRAIHGARLGLPRERVQHLVGGAYDYWDELAKEYEYMIARDGRETPYSNRDGYARLGRFDLVRTAGHLDETLTEDNERVAVVLTLGGAHAFALGQADRRLPITVILQRIERLKRWPHPVLFATFADHFDNGLLGHAASFPYPANLWADQSRRLGSGFEPDDDAALRAVRAALDLDADGRDLGGRRILVDVAHMSPASRRTYYERVLEPANEAAQRGEGRPVPLVISHAAYGGFATLEELALAAARGDRSASMPRGIDLTDEDLRWAIETRGIVGVTLDRALLDFSPGDHDDLVARQLFALIEAGERLCPGGRVWDTLAVGTDFDGGISPARGYAAAECFPRLRVALRAALASRAELPGAPEGDVDALVDRVLWRNAYEFARRELPTRSKLDLG